MKILKWGNLNPTLRELLHSGRTNAERELEKSLEQTKTEAGIVVVQNPYTGEILALANRWSTA